MKKILIIPPGIEGGWYMEAHAEYLVRYLSDEFFIEIADVPYPPYENFLDRYPETNPFQRNPDDYDLLMPLLSTHWGVTERDKYAHKMAIVHYEPGEGRWQDVAVVGATTPVVEKALYGTFHHILRFGIDTLLFRPLEHMREDNMLHVGIIGTHINPRRQILEGIVPLFDMHGVRFMFFPSTWKNNGGDLNKVGGSEFLKRVVTGGKYWPGLPNVYARMDVLLRVDNSYGYSFPTLEAAACGVPVIATYQGIDHFITDAGGGILITPDDSGEVKRWPFNRNEELVWKLRTAIEFMRDNPEARREMGRKAREEIDRNWTWDKFTPAWRKFFRDGVIRAKLSL